MELNPKQKAKELIKQYDFVYIQNYTSMYEVKQCAIILVNEIIKSHPCKFDGYEYQSNFKYWKMVLEEIENYEL